MKLIFGTNNPAKLDYMKHILDNIGLDVVGLDQQTAILPNVEEDGNTPLENACISKIFPININQVFMFVDPMGYAYRMMK